MTFAEKVKALVAETAQSPQTPAEAEQHAKTREPIMGDLAKANRLRPRSQGYRMMFRNHLK